MTKLSRRNLLQGAVLTAGAVSLIKGSILPKPAFAQDLPPGTVHSFSTGGVTFHSYVSPAPAVNVTGHIVETDSELLVVDATMLPPTAMEFNALIKSTGKPVAKAVLSHLHPDHWGGMAIHEGITFETLPAIVAGVQAEEGFPTPPNLAGTLALGTSSIGGVEVEFRNYQNAEAPDMVVAVFPAQRVAIVQDLVYNGVYFAPGADRKNWIATLEGLAKDPAFDTLLVGHGLPTSRGELDVAIAYLKTFDEVMETAATPDDAIAAMKAAYPNYSGDFLLGLINEYWAK